MATRAVVAETLVIVGSGLGGVLTGLIGGRMTYGLVAAGLLVLGCVVWLRPFRLGLPKAPIGGEPPSPGMGLSVETS